MHPISGYPLNKLTFKPTELEQINIWLAKINNHLSSVNFGTLPVDSVDESILGVSLDTFSKIQEIKPWLIELSLVHPKVELSKEYLQGQELLNLIPSFQVRIQSFNDKFQSGLKRKISELINEVGRSASSSNFKDPKKVTASMSQNYLLYSDFQESMPNILGFNQTLGDLLAFDGTFEDSLTKIFKILKQEVLAKKCNLKALTKKLNTSEIQIKDLEEQDPIAYEYLRTQAFQQFCEGFKISVTSDRNHYQAFVRPNDYIGQSFKLKSTEAMIFVVSLDPIKSFGTEKGQLLQSRGNLGDFTVVSDQVTQKREIKTFYKADDQSVQLIIPVYYSYVKADLSIKKALKN